MNSSSRQKITRKRTIKETIAYGRHTLLEEGSTQSRKKSENNSSIAATNWIALSQQKLCTFNDGQLIYPIAFLRAEVLM